MVVAIDRIDVTVMFFLLAFKLSQIIDANTLCFGAPD